MKITTKKIDDCRVKVTVAADAAEAKPVYDKVANEYRNYARIPGFRPGKAPISVIEKAYGKQFTDDVRNHLILHFYDTAVKDEKLDVVSQVSTDLYSYDAQNGLNLEFTVDIRPEFTLPKYKDMSIEKKQVVVEDADVQKELVNIRDSMAPYEDTKDKVANGDFVEISFSSDIDAAKFGDAAKDAERLVSSEGFWVEVGADNEAIPGVSKNIVGLGIGDTFDFSAKFPKDFYVDVLRGVKAKYTGAVKNVRRKRQPTDEELVKNTGMKDIEDVKAHIRKHIEGERNSAELNARKEQIRNWLLKKAGSFSLPQAILQLVANRNFDTAAGQLAAEKKATATEEWLDAHAKDVQKRADEMADRQLRLMYILDAIAKEEKITVSQAEEDREVASLARYFAQRSESHKNLTPEGLHSILERNGDLYFIRAELLNAKVLDALAK